MMACGVPAPQDDPRSSDRTNEHGLALLVVLWLIASGTLLVASFNSTVRSGVSFVRSEVQLSQLDSLLDAGVEIAATRLIDEQSARRWRPDGGAHTVDFAGSRLRIRIQDPNGLVDLNKADEKLLFEFFKRFTATVSDARLIRDRIIIARGEMPGTEGGRPSQADGGGGERKRALTTAFMDVGQLRQISGVSMDLFRSTAQFLTVFSRDGSINPLTAPEETFAISPSARDPEARAQRTAFLTGGTARSVNSGPDDEDAAKVDDFGPAFIVMVEAADADGNTIAGKTFVIATGLDQNAPYRMLSVRPSLPNYR